VKGRLPVKCQFIKEKYHKDNDSVFQRQKQCLLNVTGLNVNMSIFMRLIVILTDQAKSSHFIVFVCLMEVIID
jgi:hypothetical protein